MGADSGCCSGPTNTMGTDMRRIVVSIASQRLHVLDNDRCMVTYPVSTAKKGIGQITGSEQTPLGAHRIVEKIGDDLPINTVFVARKPTGEIYTPTLAKAYPDRDWILTRILWLGGLEPGFNQGGSVDTQERKIYIHASPESRAMGVPQSHGCITLHSQDMLDLFNIVEVGDAVLIQERALD